MSDSEEEEKRVGCAHAYLYRGLYISSVDKLKNKELDTIDPYAYVLVFDKGFDDDYKEWMEKYPQNKVRAVDGFVVQILSKMKNHMAPVEQFDDIDFVLSESKIGHPLNTYFECINPRDGVLFDIKTPGDILILEETYGNLVYNPETHEYHSYNN